MRVHALAKESYRVHAVPPLACQYELENLDPGEEYVITVGADIPRQSRPLSQPEARSCHLPLSWLRRLSQCMAVLREAL